MALLQNKSRNAQYPLRESGGVAFSNRVNFGPRLANNLNKFVGGITNKQSSMPNGYNLNNAWLPSRIGGGLVCYTGCTGSGALDAAVLAMGRGLSVTATGIGTLSTADLQLIVGLAGTLNGEGILSNSDLAGILQLAGTATSEGIAIGDLGAIINMVATAIGNGYASGNLTGLGFMSGTVSPYTELSPQSLSAAVWQAIIAQYSDVGTAGKALQDAGAAGNPWSADSTTNNDPGTMGEKLNDAASSGSSSSSGLTLAQFLALK